MAGRDLGSVDPEEFLPLLRSAYAIALLLPPALTPRDHAHQRGTSGAEAALWLAAGVDPSYVVTWLHGEAHRLQASIDAPVAPPPELPRPVCPECTAGKHGNCDGTAWDDAADEAVPCECPEEAEHP